MKKCRKCGKYLPDDAVFCRWCGVTQDETSSAEAAKPQVAPRQSQAAQPKKAETTAGGAFMRTFLRSGCFALGVYMLASGMWPGGLIMLAISLFLFSR